MTKRTYHVDEEDGLGHVQLRNPVAWLRERLDGTSVPRPKSFPFTTAQRVRLAASVAYALRSNGGVGLVWYIFERPHRLRHGDEDKGAALLALVDGVVESSTAQIPPDVRAALENVGVLR